MAVTKEVPRWRKKAAQPHPVIHMNGRQARKLARTMGRELAKAPEPVTGRRAVRPAPVPGADLAVRTGVHRYRKQLVPFWWLAALLAAGLGMHRAHALPAAFLTALGSAVAIVLLTRHLSRFARSAALWMALMTNLWLPLLAGFGAPKPLPVLLLACWLAVAIPWAHHYRWRAPEPEAEPVAPPPGDAEIFARLAARSRWAGHLDRPEDVPGGRRWRIVLDGAETHIGQLMTEPRRIAAAWGKPITEAYAEPSPDGIESLGRLTILRRNSLEAPREWDGAGIDPVTGMVTIGRFPDGSPMRIQFFTRRNGVVHSLIAGTTGAGKSYLLSLILCAAVASPVPVIPIVLDPQEGQSLPEWRKHVLYASGPDECMRYLRGIHAGMLGRSAFLSRLRWTDEDGDERDGCDFYDHEITGLPLVLPILDEAPALLTHAKYGEEATYLVADNGKRGRKAGVAEVLAAGIPSLRELGGDQALRDMLAGGNTVGLRTANRVTQGMIGLASDPADLPKFFANGEKTHGLCYVSGPDNCQAPGRLDIVRKPGKVAAAASIPPLDVAFAEAMDRALGKGGVILPSAGVPAAASLTAVPPPDDDAPEGRTASDAILAVLQDAGRELERGEIAKRCAVVAREWGRAKPFGIRAIADALNALTRDDRIEKTRQGVYRLTRPVLTVMAGTAATDAAANRG